MKKIIPTPHDRFFRNALSDPRVAKAFFEKYLPITLQEVIDLNHLTLCKESYLDERLKLIITDMLFKTEIKGEKGYIYLLNEHLSRPQKMMAFYLLKCMVRIMEQDLKKYGRLPIVYPIVFYTGNESYRYSTDIFDLFEEPTLAKDIFLNPFQLIKVHQGKALEWISEITELSVSELEAQLVNT